MELRLSGTYLLTGAAGELGRVVAPAFQAAGARVVLADRLASEVEALGRAIGARALTADLRDADQALAVTVAAEDEGSLAGLVHLVGAFAKRGAAEADEGLYDLLLDTNLRTLVNCVRAVLPGMLRRRAGFIAGVATNLVWSRAGGTGMALYAAAKGAVAQYLAALEREVRPAGIGVTTVYPLSSFDTPANRLATPAIDPDTWLDPEEVAAALVFAAARGPRGRLLELPMVSAHSAR